MAASQTMNYALQRWKMNLITNAERASLGVTLGPINKFLIVYDTDDEEYYMWDGVSSWIMKDFLAGGGGGSNDIDGGFPSTVYLISENFDGGPV